MATGISMATFSVEVFYQLLCSRHGDWYINGHLQCWSILPAATLPTWQLVYQWPPSVLKSFTSYYAPNMATGISMPTFRVEVIVHGYHGYQSIWTPTVREEPPPGPNCKTTNALAFASLLRKMALLLIVPTRIRRSVLIITVVAERLG